jgi:hypothetical protein
MLSCFITNILKIMEVNKMKNILGKIFICLALVSMLAGCPSGGSSSNSTSSDGVSSAKADEIKAEVRRLMSERTYMQYVDEITTGLKLTSDSNDPNHVNIKGNLSELSLFANLSLMCLFDNTYGDSDFNGDQTYNSYVNNIIANIEGLKRNNDNDGRNKLKKSIITLINYMETKVVNVRLAMLDEIKTLINNGQLSEENRQKISLLGEKLKELVYFVINQSGFHRGKYQQDIPSITIGYPSPIDNFVAELNQINENSREATKNELSTRLDELKASIQEVLPKLLFKTN